MEVNHSLQHTVEDTGLVGVVLKDGGLIFRHLIKKAALPVLQ